MIDRRTCLISAAASAAGAALGPGAWAAEPSVPLDWLDPYGSPTAHYSQVRKLFNTPADVERVAKLLWDRYAKTKQTNYGHWALNYTYLWWQSVPQGDQRVRTARIGQKMAAEMSGSMPESAAGPFWGAVFFGFEALARGILNSLQMIPDFLERLDEAERRDPTYQFGSVYMARAKMYIKLPPFPVSLGSLDKGYEYLEKARPLQEDTYALWYIVLAEAELQRRGKDAAFQALEKIEQVCPVDMQTRYTYELSVYLAERFREAVAKDTYDKYTWDPLLEPVLDLRNRVITPPKLCG